MPIFSEYAAQSAQSYNGPGFYDRSSYPPPHEEYDHQARIAAGEQYRHGSASHEYPQAAYGDDGNFNDLKPPANPRNDQKDDGPPK